MAAEGEKSPERELATRRAKITKILNGLMSLKIWHGRGERMAEATKSLETELINRQTRIYRMQQEFISSALAAGVSPIDIPAQIAEAMTKGLLPTVLEHVGTTREGYKTLIFLDVLPGGGIPPEAIRLTSDAFMRVDGPVLNTMGFPNVIEGYEGQYRITYGEVPISTTRIVDQDNIGFINKMDAHIPDSHAFTKPAEPSLLQLLEKH